MRFGIKDRGAFFLYRLKQGREVHFPFSAIFWKIEKFLFRREEASDNKL